MPIAHMTEILWQKTEKVEILLSWQSHCHGNPTVVYFILIFSCSFTIDMHVQQGYSTLSICLSPSSPALQTTRQPVSNTNRFSSTKNVAILLKLMRSRASNWHC